MSPEQLYDRAQKLLAQKQHDEAYKILKKLDISIPNHPGILYLLGICQSLGGNKENAIKTYLRVLQIHPSFIEAMNNLGLDLKHLKRHKEALSYFDKALELQPHFFDAQLNKASTLLAIHEDQAASDLLIHLLKTTPNHPKVLANLGTAHLKTRNPKAALEHFSAARQLIKNDLEITRGYFSALFDLNKWETIIKEYNALASEIANDSLIKKTLFSANLQTNDWTAVTISLNESKNLCSAFDALCIIDDPIKLLEIATQSSPKNNSPEPAFSYKNQKLRIGYMSSDFKNHPISILTNKLYAAHDKDKFEVHGIAIDRFPPTDDKYRKKISSDCYDFHDIGDLTDAEATDFLRKINLDILIDLNGHTSHNRMQIISNRCAPIQIQYLGFPGTTGSNFIDYTIGDPIITPPSHFDLYSEKIITLPVCFQVNDDQRTFSSQNSRSKHQLPEGDFIFACFNQHIKITSTIFDAWLRILQSVPQSILWLAQSNPVQASNLITYAQSRGINADRFIFAERIPYEQHLGRYEVADLVLDTYPFNGGTTTSDALWAGAPLVTMAGESYSSRMSSSLLNSVGLAELVTSKLHDYEALAVNLATDREKLGNIRQRLQSNLKNAPAFNTDQFVRHLELGLMMATERHQMGLKPDHLSVPFIKTS